MIDVLSKLRNAAKKLQQELGREPTTEEIAARRRHQPRGNPHACSTSAASRSASTGPIGESDDCSFGEFVEDTRHRKPAQAGQQRPAAGEDRRAAEDAHLPRAGDHPPALRPGRRLHLHAGRGRPHLQGHPRARAADRSQSGRQAAAPGPQPLPGTVRTRPRRSPRRNAGRRAINDHGRRSVMCIMRAAGFTPAADSRIHLRNQTIDSQSAPGSAGGIFCRRYRAKHLIRIRVS